MKYYSPFILPSILATVFTVAFLDKAFTIDDTTFLRIAEHMLQDPLHPTAFAFVHHGELSRASTGVMGPVMPILLLPSVLAGGSEWLAHLFMLPVFLLGIISCGALALRLGMTRRQAFWVSLVATTSPGVLGLAATSLPDVPAMSFAALAVERLYAYKDDRRLGAGVVSAIAFALAFFSRPHLAALLVCVVPLLLDGWPGSCREALRAVISRQFLFRLLPIVGGIGLILALNYMMRDPMTGSDITSSTKGNAGLWQFRLHSSALPAQWVLTFPLGIAWTIIYWKKMSRSPLCWVSAFVGLCLVAAAHTVGTTRSWPAFYYPVTALGMAVLADIFLDTWRRRDHVQLALALWLLIPWPVAIYSHYTAKYLVPAVPAMALIIVRHAGWLSRPVLGGQLMGALCAAGTALGCLIASADAALADAGRTGGKLIAEEVSRGEKVWYDGGWGFAWYATKAGAKPMAFGQPLPQSGDLVVVGNARQGLIELIPKRTLLKEVTFSEPGGRTQEPPAGFLTQYRMAPLPWIWSRQPLARIEIWRVN